MSRGQFAAHFADHPRIVKRADQMNFTEGGCWIWPTSTHYAQLAVKGGSPMYVHRISLEIKRGAPLGRLHARHSCDTPLCIAPAHLEAGTRSDNMRDMHNRGRHRGGAVRGIGNPKATLTDDQVIEALELLASGMTCNAVARQFGVSFGAVKAWRDGKFRTEARLAWLARAAA